MLQDLILFTSIRSLVFTRSLLHCHITWLENGYSFQLQYYLFDSDSSSQSFRYPLTRSFQIRALQYSYLVSFRQLHRSFSHFEFYNCQVRLITVRIHRTFINYVTQTELFSIWSISLVFGYLIVWITQTW